MGRTNHTAHYRKDTGKKQSDRKITILEDSDFEFWESDLNIIAEMYTGYQDIGAIAKKIKRKDPDEVMFAVVHLAKERKLKKREGEKAMKKRCYPDCKEVTSTGALEPLCVHHHKSIEVETDSYTTKGAQL